MPIRKQAATLTYEFVWHQGELPLIQRTLEAAAQLAAAEQWLDEPGGV